MAKSQGLISSKGRQEGQTGKEHSSQRKEQVQRPCALWCIHTSSKGCDGALWRIHTSSKGCGDRYMQRLKAGLERRYSR